MGKTMKIEQSGIAIQGSAWCRELVSEQSAQQIEDLGGILQIAVNIHPVMNNALLFHGTPQPGINHPRQEDIAGDGDQDHRLRDRKTHLYFDDLPERPYGDAQLSREDTRYAQSNVDEPAAGC